MLKIAKKLNPPGERTRNKDIKRDRERVTLHFGVTILSLEKASLPGG